MITQGALRDPLGFASGTPSAYLQADRISGRSRAEQYWGSIGGHPQIHGSWGYGRKVGVSELLVVRYLSVGVILRIFYPPLFFQSSIRPSSFFVGLVIGIFFVQDAILSSLCPLCPLWCGTTVDRVKRKHRLFNPPDLVAGPLTSPGAV
jgi:hypothetical protein